MSALPLDIPLPQLTTQQRTPSTESRGGAPFIGVGVSGEGSRSPRRPPTPPLTSPISTSTCAHQRPELPPVPQPFRPPLPHCPLPTAHFLLDAYLKSDLSIAAIAEHN